MTKWLSRRKFKQQLYLCFSGITVLAVLLIMQFSFWILWEKYRTDVIANQDAQAQQIASNIEVQLAYYLSVLDILSNDSTLRELLGGWQTAEAKRHLEKQAETFLDSHKGRIRHLNLYRMSDYSGNVDAALPNYIANLFAYDGNVKRSNTFFTPTYTNESNERVFSIFRKITDAKGIDNTYVELCIYETEMYTFFNKSKESSRIYVYNNEKLMSSSDRAYLDAQARLQKDFSREGSLVTGNPEQVISEKRMSNGWIVMIELIQDRLNGDFFKGYRNLFLGAFLSMLVTIGMVSIIARQFDGRMRLLMKKVSHIGMPEPSACIVMEGNDEFKSLFDALEDSSVRIKQLIEEVRQKDGMKRRAEIKALRSQINSHFLFNSLSSIKWLTKIGNYKTIDEAVNHLSSFLHFSLSIDDDFILLSEELEHLEAYVYLQKLRYGEEIVFQVDVEEELLCQKTTKIILQPLIENAIYHARNPEHKSLNIVVYGYREGDYYIIVVEDDGVGMTKEQITGIYSGEIIPKNNGYGLKNVIDRVSLCFEGKGKVSLDSKQGVYTRVTIIQPYIET